MTCKPNYIFTSTYFGKLTSSYRQIYARDSNYPERGISAGLENTKEIHNTITNLNQQNREYYSLRFAEVQKELAGMRVELGKIE